MVELKDRLAKDADSLLLSELMRLSDAQFDEVMKQLMIELRVEPRKIRNKSTYYFAEVVSTKDQNREIMFVNKGTGMIGLVDVEKLATYSEKVRAPRSILINLGDISRDAEKEGHRRGVRLINGSNLAKMIRESNLENLILKEFAEDIGPPLPQGKSVSPEGRIAAGVELMQAGDLVKALEHFDRAIAADPDSEIAWRMKGEVLDQLGHHGKALECFGRALEINPKGADLWYAIGVVMYSLGRYEDELQAYGLALESDPKLEKAWEARGATMLKLHRHKEALEALDKLIKLNPRIVKAHNNRGLALSNLNNLEQAIDAFEVALSLDPEFAEAWSNKGSLLIQIGRYDEALACFEHLVSLRPDMVQAWKTKGELEGKLGKHSESIVSLEKVMAADPTDANTLKLLDTEKAKAHAQQTDLHSRISSVFGRAGVKIQPTPIAWEASKEEKPKAAEEEEEPGPEAQPVREPLTGAEAGLEPVQAGKAEEPAAEQPSQISEEFLVLEPEGIGEPLIGVAEEVFGDAAELMILMKRPEVALEEIEKGLRLEPLSIRMMILKGIALHRLNDNDEAQKSFVRATELDQGNEEAIYSIEYILSSKGKFNEAEEALEPLLDGGHWMPEILAAMDSAAAGKMKKVEEHMDAAISLVPSAMAWNFKGLLDLDQGDFEKAIKSFERARELEEVFSDPSNNTGVAYQKLGSIDDASNCYDLAISSHPRSWIAWSNRGVLLTSQDRHKEALACFDQALLLESSPLVLLNKGFSQLSTDELDDALKSFESSLQAKETPEGFNDKGITLARMGKYKEAIDCFKKSLSLSPEFDDAQENFDRYEPMAVKAPRKGKERKTGGGIELPIGTPQKIWDELGVLDRPTLNRKKKPELEEICEALGLSAEGTKKDIVERILSAYLEHKLEEELDEQ